MIMSKAKYIAMLEGQGVEVPLEMCFVCPLCGTVQNANDLIAAGAGKSFADVDGYVGYSCVGRWTHHKEPPPKGKMGTQIGCNWTLGGFLQLHDLAVIDDKGFQHPRFEPATPEQAQDHIRERQPASPSVIARGAGK